MEVALAAGSPGRVLAIALSGVVLLLGLIRHVPDRPGREGWHWWCRRARGIDGFTVVTTGAGVGYGLVIHGRQVITPDTGLGLGGH